MMIELEAEELRRMELEGSLMKSRWLPTMGSPLADGLVETES